jgi:hypothetical protein
MSTIENELPDADDNAGPLNREKLERELGKFGAAFGKGLNSRPAAGLMAVSAANSCKDVGPDDAEDLYNKFASAAAKHKGMEYATSGSHKVQVSKFKRFLMVGTLTAVDGVDVMNRASDLVVKLSRMTESPLKGSGYDNLVNIARKQIEQPTKALSDDEIEGILSEQTPEKTALDLVINAYKGAYRLEEKLRDAGVDPTLMQGAEEATLNYAEQIKALDGELPAMTKEEKKISKAKDVLTKAGVASFTTVADTIPLPEMKIVGHIDQQQVA